MPRRFEAWEWREEREAAKQVKPTIILARADYSTGALGSLGRAQAIYLAREGARLVPYVASKGAMLGLTKSLAREFGPSGIRVNAVSPGSIVSEAEVRVFGDRLQQYNDWLLENQCLKMRGQPEDVPKLVLFLVSPESDFITGQNIGIDGEW